jgi:hypothetical protein
MSGFQKFIKLIVSKRTFEAMEAESRSWKVTCECGWSQSIWDMGGIRYKGGGNPRTFGKCPGCGQRRWFVIVKVQTQGS